MHSNRPDNILATFNRIKVYSDNFLANPVNLDNGVRIVDGFCIFIDRTPQIELSLVIQCRNIQINLLKAIKDKIELTTEEAINVDAKLTSVQFHLFDAHFLIFKHVKKLSDATQIESFKRAVHHFPDLDPNHPVLTDDHEICLNTLLKCLISHPKKDPLIRPQHYADLMDLFNKLLNPALMKRLSPVNQLSLLDLGMKATRQFCSFLKNAYSEKYSTPIFKCTSLIYKNLSDIAFDSHVNFAQLKTAEEFLDFFSQTASFFEKQKAPILAGVCFNFITQTTNKYLSLQILTKKDGTTLATQAEKATQQKKPSKIKKLFGSKKIVHAFDDDDEILDDSYFMDSEPMCAISVQPAPIVNQPPITKINIIEDIKAKCQSMNISLEQFPDKDMTKEQLFSLIIHLTKACGMFAETNSEMSLYCHTAAIRLTRMLHKYAGTPEYIEIEKALIEATRLKIGALLTTLEKRFNTNIFDQDEKNASETLELIFETQDILSHPLTQQHKILTEKEMIDISKYLENKLDTVSKMGKDALAIELGIQATPEKIEKMLIIADETTDPTKLSKRLFTLFSETNIPKIVSAEQRPPSPRDAKPLSPRNTSA